ncbi:hypothetical protein C2S52_017572 [Perilla frutescens var. hirtella]|nr:hypothetical protein C2S52_017572 [Perilla frutescens var. hirtella]
MAANGNAANGNADDNRTLRQLVFPTNMNLRPMGIALPAVTQNWDIHANFIQILPKFHGMLGEDPSDHGREEYVRLVSFPFTLQDGARDWLYTLPTGAVTTWRQLQQKFLEKYFPASRVQEMRRRIGSLKMGTNESFYDYWGRFQTMLAKCPQYQITEHDLIQYFIGGLRPHERTIMNASCGGSILNKQSVEAFRILTEMAEDNRDFSGEGIRVVSETERAPDQDSRIDRLCDKIEKILSGASMARKPRPCGVCKSISHFTDECPTLQDEMEEVNAVGGQNGHSRRYDPHSQTYNPGWRDHENFRWRRPEDGHPARPLPPPEEKRKPSRLEDLVFAMAEENEKFKQETRAGLSHMSKQINQLAQAMHKMEEKNGKLPSQVENPREQVNAVALRSGKEFPEMIRPREEKDDVPLEEEVEKIPTEDKAQEAEQTDAVPISEVKQSAKMPTPERRKPPFPGRLTQNRKEEETREMLKVFSKVKINIPLIEAIKQVPRYARFLKKLCTRKVRFNDDARFLVGENISAVIQRKLPKKCDDPGMFMIPCIIGDRKVEKAMLDLGASINVMPLSVFKELKIGPLKKTRVVIQLADRSNVYPEGLIEDVLVKVDELIFPVDFYVLDMGTVTSKSSVLLLGRPFMKTARTKIDVDKGTLTCEFDGEKVTFNIFEVIKHPPDTENCNFVNTFHSPSRSTLSMVSNREPLEWALWDGLNNQDALNEDEDIRDGIMMLYSLEEMPHGCVDYGVPIRRNDDKLMSSIVKAPTLELKALPRHLKYVYLGDNETLHVIIKCPNGAIELINPDTGRRFKVNGHRVKAYLGHSEEDITVIWLTEPTYA